MKNLNPRFLYLLPLLLTVALIVFGEALGDLWKEDVKALFQQNKWALLAFVGLLALLGFLWERQQRSEKPAPEEVDKDQYDEAFVQFRKNLLEQYQIRLNSKTGRRLPINLTAKSTHFGTAPDRVRAYFKDKELAIESENIASEIDKILKTNARLLLIGDPGAGKTTILLFAAINILNDAREPKLPLLLNLATWSEERDFAEWYAQSIAHTYSLSPVFVRELLRRNAVVPFFDGFDEVAEKHRDDCFQKMAAYFGDQSNRQLIVSSRKKEYAAAKADAPVYAEIEVQPLSLAQIKMSLSENAQSQAADRALLHALEHDRWLAEAVETPFYLNTASFLFGKGQRTLADFPFRTRNKKGRQAELVNIFVAEQVPGERDRKYLSFLAKEMELENFLVFELVKMQPGWGGKLWWYHLAFSLIFGSAVGLTFGLLFGLVSGLVSSLVLGLAFGLVGHMEKKNKISSEDIQIWSWSEFKKNWKIGLVRGLAIGSALGLTIGLVSILFNGLVWSLVWGLVGVLVWGLVGGLVGGLTWSLKIVGTTTNYLLHLTNPYQRFWATFRNSLWYITLMILSLLIASLAANFWEGKNSWEELRIWMQYQNLWLRLLVMGLFFSLLLFVNANFADHFSLRLILYLEGKMPLRVVTFMDRMSEQLIFEDNRRSDKKGNKRRGATWRFRHKILQDYFAKLQ